ncbi:MAG: Teichoic acids export ATP-binding protein TagH [candidate division BRC1 bacterium ADurb.BinA364]|nr:MAG: Teichoic acids export ATP-binding protein TagH [candidate division BRC1 bacterium ADurb.BinA364]
MAWAIQAEGVSKKYSRLAGAGRLNAMLGFFRELAGRAGASGVKRGEFWAVDNVSFRLAPGEALGLVGLNGSGKTTLLKMLAGLAKPDRGRIEIRGAVRPLINLGTGFNPRLTGLENIRNAASLFGAPPAAARKAIASIVDFAELEEAIESPFETYSSGMKARLGFAAAVCFRPDVLLVDEILSVGDYSFQKKSLGRMRELKREGAAILLVSHNLPSVIELCDRAIWLDKGRLRQIGPAEEVAQAYLRFVEEAGKAERDKELARLNKQRSAIRLEQQAQEPESLYGPMYPASGKIADLRTEWIAGGERIAPGAAADFRFSFELVRPVSDLNVSLVVYAKNGKRCGAISTLNGDLLKKKRKGRVQCLARFGDLCLAPGRYALVMPIHEGKSYLYRGVVREFEVAPDGRFHDGLFFPDYTFRAECGAVKREFRSRLAGMPPLLRIEEAAAPPNEARARGWAMAARPIDAIEIWIGARRIGLARHGLFRADAAAANPEYGITHCGFEFEAPLAEAVPAEGQLEARAYWTGETVASARIEPFRPAADLPTLCGFSRVAAQGGAIEASGWVVSPRRIDRIEAFWDGASLGLAETGLRRNDVFEKRPEYGARLCGFRFRAELSEEALANAEKKQARVRIVSGEETLLEWAARPTP